MKTIDYGLDLRRGGWLRGVGMGMMVVAAGIAVGGVMVGVSPGWADVLNWMGKSSFYFLVVGIGVGICGSVILGCVRSGAMAYGVIAVGVMGVELGVWVYLGGWIYFG